MPRVRRTLARQGRTPVLEHRARHRDKLSAAGALSLSPARGHISLYCQTYPDTFVDAEVYAHFLSHMLAHVRGAVVLVHDGGPMHKGEPIRALCERHPRLDVNLLPAYAPELNPVEYLWNFLKDKELANFAPQDVPQLEGVLCHSLEDIRHDQPRLKTFYESSPLPWNTTGLI